MLPTGVWASTWLCSFEGSPIGGAQTGLDGTSQVDGEVSAMPTAGAGQAEAGGGATKSTCGFSISCPAGPDGSRMCGGTRGAGAPSPCCESKPIRSFKQVKSPKVNRGRQIVSK